MGVQKNGFSEDRIRSGVQKLIKARKRTNQGRLDTFFKPIQKPNVNNNSNNDAIGCNTNKRKVDETKAPNDIITKGKNVPGKKNFSIFTKPNNSKRKKK